MNNAQLRIISLSTALGAFLGMLIGLVVAQSKKEQLEIAAKGGNQINLNPSITEVIGLTVAAVTLLRQIVNILTPKSG